MAGVINITDSRPSVPSTDAMVKIASHSRTSAHSMTNIASNPQPSVSSGFQ